MSKHPLSYMLDKLEADLLVRKREKRVADAGPELLAALKGLVECYNMTRRGVFPAGHPVRRALDAIAKAEGG